MTLPHVGRDVERVADLGEHVVNIPPLVTRVANPPGNVADDTIANAGATVPQLVLQRGEVEDLLKAGIGDPTRVTRSALPNAASIAQNILTTEAIVAEAPEKAGAGMGGGMPDMGGMM